VILIHRIEKTQLLKNRLPFLFREIMSGAFHHKPYLAMPVIV